MLISSKSCRINCKNCGHRFYGQHLSGGFVYQEWLEPKVCPKCKSRNIKEATLLDWIFGLFK